MTQPLPSRPARSLAALFVLVGPLLIAAEPGPALVSTNGAAFLNPDFEAGDPGATPPGWFVPKVLAGQGFSAVVSTNQPQHGQQCVEIRWPTDRQPSPGLFANLMQRLEAAPWRGKRVKVTASIRVSGTNPAARAQMWLRVDRAGGMGAFDNMNDRPVHSDAWADYSITVDVADDARSLNLGLMALDGATAWWDHVRFEVLSGFTTVTEPPHPLTNAGLSNLVAYARLLGYVRHFHPSDQAATNDWLPFVVAALPQVETAETPQALAAALEAIFLPVAPTVRVFQEGAGVQVPAELSPVPGNSPLKIRVWEHVGYRHDAQAGVASIYTSQRLSLDAREPATLPAYAQPTNVFRSRLGADVECLVPTALFANDGGTLPHADRVAPEPRTETRFSVDHRGARLATVMIAWSILQHFYPYWDVIDTDWPRQLEVALRDPEASCRQT